MKEPKVAVLGAGMWGTVLAQCLAERGSLVALWEFFPDRAGSLEMTRQHPQLPGLRLHPRVAVASGLEAVVDGARLVLVVLPSQHVRNAGKHLKPLLAGRRAQPVVVSASKGIEPSSLKTMAEVLEEECPSLKGKVLVLSGPSFAREVARGVPTKVLLAGKNGPSSKAALDLLGAPPLRVARHEDRKGVELGGGLKNVLAIGCGVLDGLGAGANTKAVLITEGIREMGELMARHGGRFETIYSLAGLGDLFATGTSIESRNRALGEKLGQGKDLRRALKEIQTVVEGVESARSAFLLARSSRLKAPILEAVYGVLHDNQPPARMLEAIGFF